MSATGGDLIFTHYLRVKVFTDRGRESQSKIDIPFGNLYGGEVKIRGAFSTSSSRSTTSV